jgi:hypothetical protein
LSTWKRRLAAAGSAVLVAGGMLAPASALIEQSRTESGAWLDSGPHGTGQVRFLRVHGT